MDGNDKNNDPLKTAGGVIQGAQETLFCLAILRLLQ